MANLQATGFDIIVAGGGSAGCAMSARLAEAGLKVLLLEAGKPDRNLWVLVPALTIATVFNPEYDWSFVAEPDPSVGGRVDHWAAGKRLGGGSAINGMIYCRGHRWDYDRWAELGAKGWGADDVMPYFKRMETTEREGSTRGKSGPITVSENTISFPVIDAFVKAAEELGIPRNPDHNGNNSGEGTDYAQASLRRGMRVSAARGYLRSGKKHPALTVLTEARVRRILIEDGRAVGVEYDHGGSMKTVLARHGVVVSAGSLTTPRLLMLSGVGPAEHLQEHGIPVKVDSPGVGANLQDHAMTHMTLPTVAGAAMAKPTGLKALGYGLEYLLFGSGPIGTSMCHAQAFVRTKPELAVPDAQISLTSYAFDLDAMGKAGLRTTPAVTITICLARPSGRGRVTLRSADPFDAPVIDYRILGTSDADAQTLAETIEIARKLLAQPAIRPLLKGEDAPGPDVTGEALLDYVRTTARTGFHPVGTCRMGEDADAVVDSDLKVRGVAGLWVADASIMPTIPVGNTNATAIMIGDKGADHVLKSIALNRAVAT